MAVYLLELDASKVLFTYRLKMMQNYTQCPQINVAYALQEAFKIESEGLQEQQILVPLGVDEKA